jgi:putative transposase
MLTVRGQSAMQLTKKIRIYPNEEQQAVLWELSDLNRRLYNYALRERRDAYEAGVQGVTYVKQQNDLPNLKEEYPDLKRVNSKVLQLTLRTLAANYNSFFALIKEDPTARPPGYKSRKYFTTMKFNQSGYKIIDSCITLNHNMKERAKLSFAIPKQEFTQVKQVEVFKDHKERWYVAVIEETTAPPLQDNGLYQAWDLGITKQTGVNSHGKFIEIINVRPDKYWNPKIDRIQSRRDHCKKKSKGRKPSRRWNHFKALQDRMMRKRGNQIRDFQHKTSLMIVKNTKANTLVIGDLDVKRMAQTKTKRLNRSTQGTGYLARFAGFLTYKAELAGKRVIEISEHNTSKSCCQCGKLHSMQVSDRVMVCDCGTVLDRDRNAAINIMSRYLSQNALWTGYQLFAGNLRKTGLDIPVLSQEAPCASLG